LVPTGCQTIKDLTGVITDQAPDLELFAIPWLVEMRGFEPPTPSTKGGRAGNDREEHRAVPQAVGWSRWQIVDKRSRAGLPDCGNPTLTCKNPVDLLRSYSNRSDLCTDLEHTARSLRQCQEDQAHETSVMQSEPRATTRHRMTERLDTNRVAELIERYQAGETGKDLADTYGISLSSVRRIVREHGAHKVGPQYHQARVAEARQGLF
jgi:hypothetical protein